MNQQVFCQTCGTELDSESFCKQCNISPGSNQYFGAFDAQNNFDAQSRQNVQQEIAAAELKRTASSAFWNGVVGIALSIWTVLAIFGLQWNDTLWVLLFVGADFFCSLPAIYNAVKSRAYNKKMFITSLAMGIISAAVSVSALIVWAAM